ncbi:MAG: hypothetical protein IME97_01365 [Proteobacteria bacterium]|nr:hypothetical protein [Pseudomonadota bacterium]
MNHTVECCIPLSHPSIAGHFPGNPIVPAVVILNEVIAACNEWQPDLSISGLSSAKFVSPLRPEEVFSIYLDTTAKNSMKFECRIEDKILVSGKLQITNSES